MAELEQQGLQEHRCRCPGRSSRDCRSRGRRDCMVRGHPLHISKRVLTLHDQGPCRPDMQACLSAV